jgi:outer membrane protein assembly complex protein YaeT
MKPLRPMLLLAAALWMAAGLFSCASLEAGPAEKTLAVGTVHVKGEKTLTEKSVRAALSLRPATWRFWRARDVFSQKTLESDLDNLRRLLESEGFYHGKVRAETHRREGARSVDIVFHIDEGPPVLVTDITITGLDAFPQDLRKRLKDAVILKTGVRFRSSLYRASRDALARALRDQGHALAKVQGSVSVSKTANTASVRFVPDPGDTCVFGPVTMKGFPKTNRKVLSALLTFQQGEPFSQRKLDESQRKIFSLGAFSTVRLETGEPSRERGAPSVPVTLDGTYKKLREVKLGLGYGSEDKFRVQAKWRHQHFASLAQRAEFTAKASSLVQSLSGEVQFPYLFSARQEASDTLGVMRLKGASYTIRSLFNHLSLTRRLGQSWELSAGQDFEIIRPEEVPRDTVETNSDYRFSALFAGVSLDTRQPIEDPLEGSYLALRCQHSDAAYGSEIEYLKVNAEARAQFPVFRRLTLAGKLLFSGIEPTGEDRFVPVFKRLFSGGGASVRGYGYQELGPRDSDGAPAGGLTLYEAGLELRFPVRGKFSGVVFTDTGHLNPEAFAFDMEEVRTTAGLGVRYGTPVGPVRVDWGFQLNPQQSEDHDWAFHLSVGQAF